jgi:hypothetical protein
VSDDCAGDGIVPAFSQLGIMVDPNDPSASPSDPVGTAPLIPAFRPVAQSGRLTFVNIPGGHTNYLNSISGWLLLHFTSGL